MSVWYDIGCKRVLISWNLNCVVDIYYNLVDDIGIEIK